METRNFQSADFALERRRVFAARRSLVAVSVVILHFIVVLYLIQIRGSHEAVTALQEPPIEVELLDAPRSIERIELKPVPLSEQHELEPPEVAAVEADESTTHGETPPPPARLRPPVLVGTGKDKLDQFRRKAALNHGQIAHVVVAVEVLPDGTTGEVSVASSSGIARADAAAIEYARSLSWSPATRGGVKLPFNVTLPVVFNADD